MDHQSIHLEKRNSFSTPKTSRRSNGLRVKYPEWINFADIGYSETVEEQDRMPKFRKKEARQFGSFLKKTHKKAVESEKIRIHSKPWEMCLALQKHMVECM